MTVGTISIIIGVVLLVLLKLLFNNEGRNSQDKGRPPGKSFKEEPELDRTWSFLPGNIFNRSKDD